MEPYVNAYRAANSLEAHMLQGLLETAGIPVRLSGEALIGGIGELPVDAVQVCILVPEGWLPKARKLLASYESRRETTWYCSQCGEANDGSFEVCWHCQHTPDVG